MKDLQLINTLCESRVFRTQQSIGKYRDQDKKELFYAVLLSTLALSQDTKTNRWAEQYASSAAAFGNFDYFRTSGTDLYILTYILQQDLGAISKAQAQVLVRVYRSLGRGNFDRSLIEQTLLRMERALNIGNAQLRNARRTIVNWVKSTPAERKQAVTRLHRFIRTKAKLAEVLPYLLVLTKDDKGHFGKMTPLKKAAAIAAAGLAGLAIGYKTHDQNKRRFNITNSVDIDDTPLTEDRATQLFQIVQNMSKHPEIEKVVNVQSLVDGISAFVRTTDGNAYEMEIRPARYAKTHTAHLREGWEWSAINEDEDDPKCQWCYDTGYATEKHWDDTVKVPCDQCDADRAVNEDDWIDNPDEDDTFSGIPMISLCPTCDKPMDKVQIYPDSKPTYVCTNCL
jgi:hypothetical protein